MPRRIITEILAIVTIALALFLPYLGASRLWDRDEPRNAGCAREMLERGDWVVPTFNDELRAHKPVLLYWLIMTAYWVWGISEFSARVGSAILATGTVLLTYWMGTRLLPPRANWWAAASLATMALFAVSARSATPDAALVFFSTLGLAVFVRGHFPPKFPTHGVPAKGEPQVPGELLGTSARKVTPPLAWKHAFLMYTAWGLAVLAKGPVGFVLPAGVTFFYLLWTAARGPQDGPSVVNNRISRGHEIGRFLSRFFSPKLWWQAGRQMRLLPGALITLAVAAPWYTAVTLLTQGAFLEEFFLRHHLRRALTPMEGHGGSILFYPVALLVGTFPWSVFVVPCFLLWRQKAKEDDNLSAASVFLLTWLIVYVGIFSLARTKLPSYLLPCYPAAALLVGLYLGELVSGPTGSLRRWTYAAVAVLGAVGLIVAIALPVAAWQFLPGAAWTGTVGLTLVAGAAVAWYWLRHEHGKQLVYSLVVTACVFVLLTVGVIPARVSRHRWLEPLLEDLRSYPVPVATVEFCEPSWVFYLGRPLPMLSRTDKNEIDSALRQGILIVREKNYEEMKTSLPPHRVVAVGPRWLRREKLYLLGAPERAESLARLIPPAGPPVDYSR